MTSAHICRSLLVVHDSRFTLDQVDTKERKELEQGTDRKARIKIIGKSRSDTALYMILDKPPCLALASPRMQPGNTDCQI